MTTHQEEQGAVLGVRAQAPAAAAFVGWLRQLFDGS